MRKWWRVPQWNCSNRTVRLLRIHFSGGWAPAVSNPVLLRLGAITFVHTDSWAMSSCQGWAALSMPGLRSARSSREGQIGFVNCHCLSSVIASRRWVDAWTCDLVIWGQTIGNTTDPARSLLQCPAKDDDDGLDGGVVRWKGKCVQVLNGCKSPGK